LQLFYFVALLPASRQQRSAATISSVTHRGFWLGSAFAKESATNIWLWLTKSGICTTSDFAKVSNRNIWLWLT